MVVLFLELHGRKITESRVQSAGVAYLVNEARKSRNHIRMSSIVTEIDLLTFDRLHEALGFAVVVGITAATHRTDQAVVVQAHDDRVRQRTALRDRRCECNCGYALSRQIDTRLALAALRAAIETRQAMLRPGPLRLREKVSFLSARESTEPGIAGVLP